MFRVPQYACTEIFYHMISSTTLFFTCTNKMLNSSFLIVNYNVKPHVINIELVVKKHLVNFSNYKKKSYSPGIVTKPFWLKLINDMSGQISDLNMHQILLRHS